VLVAGGVLLGPVILLLPSDWAFVRYMHGLPDDAGPVLSVVGYPVMLGMALAVFTGLLAAAVAFGALMGAIGFMIWTTIFTVLWLLGGMDGSWVDAIFRSGGPDCGPGEVYDVVGVQGVGPASNEVYGCVPRD
jgi:hypothetical protein